MIGYRPRMAAGYKPFETKIHGIEFYEFTMGGEQARYRLRCAQPDSCVAFC